MKIVIDMNLSTDWAGALREAGIEAVHWSMVGPHDAGDETISAWARENHAVVLTRDLDFAALLIMSGRGSPSVVQLRVERARPETHLSLVRRALTVHQAQLERGAILTLEENRVRVRVLDGGKTS